MQLLVRLLKGEVPLVYTYWGFGVAAWVLLGILNSVILFNYSALSLHVNVDAFIVGLAYFLIVYQLFISIALWNSAKHYTGLKIWAVLAKLVAVALIASLILKFVINGYQYRKPQNLVLLQKINFLNQSLPKMVDKDTQLDYIGLQGDNLYYNYRFPN